MQLGDGRLLCPVELYESPGGHAALPESPHKALVTLSLIMGVHIIQCVYYWQSLEFQLGVAEGTVLETQSLDLFIEETVLATLAGEVVLGEDALSRGHAGLEVGPAGLAVGGQVTHFLPA